jgi:hypothetical protein
MDSSSMLVDNELWWFLCPICSVLWQAGGTWNKLWRRIGVPCVILTSCLLSGICLWQSLLASILLFAATTLPFTLRGDSVKSYWYNWVWIWVWALLLLLPSQLLQLDLTTVVIPLIALGSLATLSNISWSARLVQWKFFEACAGILVAYPFCMILSK